MKTNSTIEICQVLFFFFVGTVLTCLGCQTTQSNPPNFKKGINKETLLYVLPLDRENVDKPITQEIIQKICEKKKLMTATCIVPKGEALENFLVDKNTANSQITFPYIKVPNSDSNTKKTYAAIISSQKKKSIIMIDARIYKFFEGNKKQLGGKRFSYSEEYPRNLDKIIDLISNIITTEIVGDRIN